MNEPNKRLKQASVYNKFFSGGAACQSQLPSCRPRVRKAIHPSTTGDYDVSVQCVKYKSALEVVGDGGDGGGAGKHFYEYHPPHTVADMDHLQHLFDNHDPSRDSANGSFLQRNRIENVIRAWKKDTYPHGLDLAAVEVERKRDVVADSEDANPSSWNNHYQGLLRKANNK
ncbi:hypothetical protein E4U32_003107 [Claviceps aff. humidiphila group G2b]|nr:hypothetical protein E4U32_003107 [Claviceps aff. humidiphila group G2b]